MMRLLFHKKNLMLTNYQDRHKQNLHFNKDNFRERRTSVGPLLSLHLGLRHETFDTRFLLF